MEVVFQGAISKSWGIKDVLKAVCDVAGISWGVLRIANPDKGIDGKIFIRQSRHVVGAQCSSSAGYCDSYEALKLLLGSSEGNYAFLQIDESADADFEHSMFIAMEQILASAPELPASPCEIFDQRALLDAVFGEDKLNPFSVAVPEILQKSLDSTMLPQLSAVSDFAVSVAPAPAVEESAVSGSATHWDSVEPLFEIQDYGAVERFQSSSMIPNYVQTPDQLKISQSRLRALSVSRGPGYAWQRMVRNSSTLKWVAAALGFSLAFFVLLPQMKAGQTRQAHGILLGSRATLR